MVISLQSIKVENHCIQRLNQRNLYPNWTEKSREKAQKTSKIWQKIGKMAKLARMRGYSRKCFGDVISTMEGALLFQEHVNLVHEHVEVKASGGMKADHPR
ncbi:MAG: hypothetical protein JXM70_12525 [Pirellulales bacterium]|nr:hypothetical protein [Pirellulales bacterium]